MATSNTPLGTETVTQARVCKKCSNELSWRDCYNCDEGFSHHDCGEDCCCCLNPEDNVTCDICNGDSGWYVCRTCSPVGELDDY
jgi:hypothetical protein